MMITKRFYLMSFLLCAAFSLLVLTNTSYGQAGSSGSSAQSENIVTIIVDWRDGKETYEHTELSSGRVRLRVIVRNLNLFQYNLFHGISVRPISETQTLLGIINALNDRIRRDTVGISVSEIPADDETKIKRLIKILNKLIGDIRDLEGIAVKSEDLRCSEVAVKFAEVTEEFGDMQPGDISDDLSGLYDDVSREYNAFLEVTNRILNGIEIDVGDVLPGTEITVELRAVKKDNTEEPVVKRVIFSVVTGGRFDLHAGFAISNLIEVESREVTRTINGTEVTFFNLTSNEDLRPLLTGFVSYELCNFLDRKFGILATIGTDSNEPLGRIYIGGSIRFGDFFFTIGGAASKIKRGIDEVEVDINGESETAFYRRVRDGWNWKCFCAFTYRFY